MGARKTNESRGWGPGLRFRVAIVGLPWCKSVVSVSLSSNSWHRPPTFDGGRRLCPSTWMAQVDPARSPACSTHKRPGTWRSFPRDQYWSLRALSPLQCPLQGLLSKGRDPLSKHLKTCSAPARPPAPPRASQISQHTAKAS